MQDKSQKRLKRIFHENYNALKTLKEKCCAELDLETFKQEYRGIQCINESVQNQESESEATDEEDSLLSIHDSDDDHDHGAHHKGPDPKEMFGGNEQPSFIETMEVKRTETIAYKKTPKEKSPQ